MSSANRSSELPPALSHDSEALLQRFEESWLAGNPPSLEQHLFSGSTRDAPSRLSLLIELIKIDLEYQWRTSRNSGGAPATPSRLEDYLVRFPELGPVEHVSVDLIEAEYRARRLAGGAPITEEYTQRFVTQASKLPALLGQINAELAEEFSQSAPMPTLAPRAVDISVGDLLNFLREHRFLKLSELQELSSLEVQGRFPDARALAQHLLQRDGLTAYQANLILQGRGQELLIGSYLVVGRLGDGNFSQVFKARHQRMNRIVALKVIRSEALADLDMATVQRFYQEIQAAGQLVHPNVVLAYDAGPVARTHFLAMEYVEGTNLAQAVRKRGPLPILVACDYIRQAALGLRHAHERGLIHRDVKPSNLLLSDAPTSHGLVKLLDLGLASLQRRGNASSSSLTREGDVMGTADYMAPEQAGDPHHVDVRADLYGLGCTFYFLLTGQPPFPGGSFIQKVDRHRWHEPQPVEQLRSDVPPQVAKIVHRLLAKRPEDRYQTAAEFGAVLANTVPDGEMVAPSLPTGPESVEQAPAKATVPAELPKRPGTQRSWRGPVIGGSFILVAILLGLLLFRPGRKSVETSPAPGQVSVAVAADRPWQDSGMDVEAGASVTLRAQENWHKGHEVCSAQGLKQAPRNRAILPEAPALALLARVGDELVPVYVGDFQVLKPKQSGRLFLQINDLDLKSNGGSLHVEIEGGRRGAPTAPPRPTLTESVEDELQLLVRKAKAPGPKESLPVEVLAFARKHPGTFQAGHALALLTQLPSPLDSLKPEDVPADCRAAAGGGDPEQAPRGLVAILGEHRADEDHPVRAIAFSPDGKLLASTTPDDFSLKVWDASTGKEIHTLVGHSGAILGLAFSPDGQTLASASRDHTIKLWAPSTGKEVRALTGHADAVHAVAFSPDGQWLASAGDDQKLMLFRVATGEEKCRQGGHTAYLTCIAFSPDGKLLATGSDDRTVKVWEAAGGKLLQTLPAQRGQITAVAFSPNGQFLGYGAGDNQLQLWNVFSKEARLLQPEQFHPVHSIAFNLDGKLLASGSADGVIRLWDAETRALKQAIGLGPASKAVYQIAFSPDGRHMASANGDGTVYVLRLTSSSR